MSNARVTEIFNGFTSADGLTQTKEFAGADFLVFSVPNLQPDEGYELAAQLTVKVEDTTKLGGLFPVVTDYGIREINLDREFVDTQEVIIIPTEFRQKELPMWLTLATVQQIEMQIYAVAIAKSCCQRVEDRVNQIKGDLDFLKIVNTGIIANQLVQDVALQTLSTGIGAALAPYTAGASLALPAATGAELVPAIGALTTLTSTLLLPGL
ncbi:MAG: hypothetical protein KME17_08150 [Cyanosarcina radialis HA8281-LM2]|jgi:hypothetical protein|nr:hypothetical protein [Cyanosarcina radialis HA8281-LM2]